MDDCGPDAQLEVAVILRKIIDDFEQLDRAIDAAIVLLKAGHGQAGDVEADVAALRRAREAARQGAALAKSKAGNE